MTLPLWHFLSSEMCLYSERRPTQTHSLGGSCPCADSLTGCGGGGRGRSHGPSRHTPAWDTCSLSSPVSLETDRQKERTRNEKGKNEVGERDEKGGQDRVVNAIRPSAWLSVKSRHISDNCTTATPSVSLYVLSICVNAQGVFWINAILHRLLKTHSERCPVAIRMWHFQQSYLVKQGILYKLSIIKEVCFYLKSRSDVGCKNSLQLLSSFTLWNHPVRHDA